MENDLELRGSYESAQRDKTPVHMRPTHIHSAARHSPCLWVVSYFLWASSTHPPTHLHTHPPTRTLTYPPVYIYPIYPLTPHKHGEPRWCADAHDTDTVMCLWHVYVHSTVYVLCVYVESYLIWVQQRSVTMGWLRLVGCLKIQVSLQNTGLFCRALLQKRRIFLSILLIVANPYTYVRV